MTTLELSLNLPDELAKKAQAAGLLSPEGIEKLLREQLRRQAGQELRVVIDRARDPGVPPLTEEEIQAEIDAYRAERRAKL